MSENGWIKHDGVTIPERAGYRREVKYRGGYFAKHPTWRGWLWSKFAPSRHDIVAFRWVKS